MHFQSRLPATLVLLLSLAAATGCRDTLPSLFLHIEDPQQLGPTQLKVTVEAEGLAPATVTRPEQAEGALTGSQTLRILLPDAAVGVTARVTVEALKARATVGRAAGSVEIRAGAETPHSVVLARIEETFTSADCTCDATTCPNGCCQDGLCVAAARMDCGTGGAACAACPAEISDRCTDGACRCGTEVACADDHHCQDGSCVPRTVPACDDASDCVRPPSQCHEDQGTCPDGTCHYAPKASTVACSDGDSCTDGDHCDGTGRCSASARTCNTPPGQCHEAAGTCLGGACQYAAKQTGASCDDNNACTGPDTCNGTGTCTSGAAKVCNTPPSPCHEAVGTCSTSTGACTYALKAVGTACNADSNACTTDTCNAAGACVASAPTACNTPPSQCHQATGTCNASTGACSYALKSAGSACNADGNACTTDVCDASGACVASAPTVCNTPPNGACWNATGTCNTSTGACAYTPKGSGTSCGFTECTLSTCNGSGTCVAQNLPDGMNCGGCATCFNGACGGGCTTGQRCCPGNLCIPDNNICP